MRRIAIGVVLLALAGGTAVAIASRDPEPTTAVEGPSIFKTATVSTGDLTTTERIDGIVQLSSTLTVLHRIEGQTSSSSGSSPAASTTATTTPSAAANPAALSSPLVAADCSTTTVPATTPATTTPEAAAPAAPTEAAPSDPPPDTTPAATTTTVPVPDPTAPADPAAAPPAQPCDTTTTTTPVTVGPTGGNGAAPVGGGPRTSGAGPASAASGSTASAARVTQTVTSIIETNTAIHQGDVLYTVDGAPVVALDGALPAWRSLSTSSDDGADVAQLEASLVAMGYDPALKVTVDTHFDSATRTMVKAWQQGLGVDETGTVDLGSVVFLPSATTVSAVEQAVGDSVGDGDTVLTLAASTQEVLIDVPAGDESQVVPGLAVQIGDVQGTVTRLRSADRSGTVAVEAVIAPSTPIADATNGTAVKVTLTLQNVAGVLIAPAEALVSRLDGSYAVQVETTDGTTKWLTVELLGVSGGNVALRGGDLTDGTIVLLPA
jgi:membrane fusion protein, multidrug efflux system